MNISKIRRLLGAKRKSDKRYQDQSVEGVREAISRTARRTVFTHRSRADINALVRNLSRTQFGTRGSNAVRDRSFLIPIPPRSFSYLFQSRKSCPEKSPCRWSRCVSLDRRSSFVSEDRCSSATRMIGMHSGSGARGGYHVLSPVVNYPEYRK